MVPDMNLVFCIDRKGVVGLHTTLSSLLAHLCSSDPVSIYLFHASLSPHDIEQLAKTIAKSPQSANVRLIPRDIEIGMFEPLKNHVGFGWMTYARILVPDLLSNLDRVIYLDNDLLVYADLHELWQHDLNGATIGCATWGNLSQSNDRLFAAEQGMPSERPYFNAGVLLIDVHKWNTLNCTNECMNIGLKYGSNLPSADQTILNVLFGDSFSAVPRRFNTPVTASRAPLSDADISDRVVHLVARPKPWDAFGSLNGQSALFDRELLRTVIPNYRRPWPRFQSLRLSPAYLKCLIKRGLTRFSSD